MLFRRIQRQRGDNSEEDNVTRRAPNHLRLFMESKGIVCFEHCLISNDCREVWSVKLTIQLIMCNLIADVVVSDAAFYLKKKHECWAR